MELIGSKGIIFAADIEQRENLFHVIQQVNPYVEAVKIGNVVLYEHGFDIIKDIKKYTDKPIILDLKLMDVPFIVQRIAERALTKGADGIVVCGPAGGDTIAVCRNIFKNKLVFVFTQFTDFSGLITDEMADEYIDLALVLKCNGIFAPGTMPQRISEIRRKIGKDLLIIACGIGKQGPKIGSGIAAGADYEIIGRYIYGEEKMMRTSSEIAKEIKESIWGSLKNV